MQCSYNKSIWTIFCHIIKWSLNSYHLTRRQALSSPVRLQVRLIDRPDRCTSLSMIASIINRGPPLDNKWQAYLFTSYLPPVFKINWKNWNVGAQLNCFKYLFYCIGISALALTHFSKYFVFSILGAKSLINLLLISRRKHGLVPLRTRQCQKPTMEVWYGIKTK